MNDHKTDIVVGDRHTLTITIIKKKILIKFGYRIFQEYLFSDDPEQKSEQIAKLQAIYEMGQLER
jgi:hypothetical protein